MDKNQKRTNIYQNKGVRIYQTILALLPKKMYSFYENLCRVIGLAFILGTIFIIIYSTYIHLKFNDRNIENADIIIESTQKFSEQEIQEFIEIAKADFIKYDILRNKAGIKQDKVYVLKSLNFIEGNELIKTKDVIVFCAEYDFYKEPLYYLFGKKIEREEYWFFIRNNETNQFYLEMKKNTFSPDDIYSIFVGEKVWRIRDN